MVAIDCRHGNIGYSCLDCAREEGAYHARRESAQRITDLEAGAAKLRAALQWLLKETLGRNPIHWGQWHHEAAARINDALSSNAAGAVGATALAYCEAEEARRKKLESCADDRLEREVCVETWAAYQAAKKTSQ